MVPRASPGGDTALSALQGQSGGSLMDRDTVRRQPQLAANPDTAGVQQTRPHVKFCWDFYFLCCSISILIPGAHGSISQMRFDHRGAWNGEGRLGPGAGAGVSVGED